MCVQIVTFFLVGIKLSVQASYEVNSTSKLLYLIVSFKCIFSDITACSPSASNTGNESDDPNVWFSTYRLPALPGYLLEKLALVQLSPSKMTSSIKNKIIQLVFDSIAQHTL